MMEKPAKNKKNYGICPEKEREIKINS